MTKTKKIPRVRVDLLLRALVYIDSHYGVAEPDLRGITGLARATNMRLLVYAREQFGVIVSWRHDNTLPSRGEYTIDDWGVFNQHRIRKFLSIEK